MRVVELGSFTKVAQHLDMSASAVTRHISLLESLLNVRLLNRNTRSVSVTESGREYYEGCHSIIERLDELESSLLESNREISGTLRVAASLTFASAGLARIISGYKALHPRIHFDVEAFDTRIDFVEGAFDICFSEESRLASSSLVSRRLMIVEDVLVASPTYLAQSGIPSTPDDLAAHCLIGITEHMARIWEFARDSKTYRVALRNGLTTTNAQIAREAVLNHMGIALLPAALVAESIMRGSLVRLFDGYELNGGTHELRLFYPGRTNLPRKVRAFIDFAVAHYQTASIPNPLRAAA